jgi:histidine ammonia-lyase
LNTLLLDGRSLSLEDLVSLFQGDGVRLEVAPDALERARASRRWVDEHVAAGDVVYGLTTGFGKLKDVAIPREELETLQRNLVLSHCCGVGEPMPELEVRTAQILRLNGLVRGCSGVRVETIEALVRLFEKGFVPVVPQQGSVGASGDLAPLAHMAAAYIGHGEAFVGGTRMLASEALGKIGEQPLELAAKEGLALINGTEIMKAIACVLWWRTRNLSKAADVVASLSIEALLGSARPFDDRLADLKNNEGHRRTAANVRACLADSEVLVAHADCNRVQDPYSLRCVPQVHGAVKTAFEHVTTVLSQEINAVTDNPLVFPDSGEVLSAGMFHGQPISMVMDYLGLALCTLANISERRTEQLVNPDLSRLPAFLSPDPGLSSGLMIGQITAAALASENKVYAHPASVDSIPTNAGQEDHVSMGVTAARKARTILDNTEHVLGIEYLCAGQGREFHSEWRAGAGAEAAHGLLREHVRPLDQDRFLHEDITAATGLIRSGTLVQMVEEAVGALRG